ncbi:MAG: sensor histidine kinase [Clostridia bacterium]|nr:sensor histidine kinase [Clostridia bacterium]
MKLREVLGLKITAVVFSYISVLILVISLLSVGVMGYYKFYFSSEKIVTEEILTDMAEKESYYIHNFLDDGREITHYYKDKNIYFSVTDLKTGKVLETNYEGQPYIAEASTVYGEYIEEEYITEEGYNAYRDKLINEYQVDVYVAKNMTKSDLFSVAKKIISVGYTLRYYLVFIALISLAVFIYTVCYLFCAAGHIKFGKIKRNFIDRIPLDILTALLTGIFLAVFAIIIEYSYNFDEIGLAMIMFVPCSALYFAVLGYCLSIATRIKTKTLLKNNISYVFLKIIKKYLKIIFERLWYIFSNLALVYKTIIAVIAVFFVEFLFCFVIGFIVSFIFSEYYLTYAVIFGLILANAVVFLLVLYIAVILQNIKSGGERIAKGDLDYKIDTRFMFSDFKRFAMSLNNINEGLQSAINEKIKSERFKTELITNVSHDIKTPLTSIVNYVDLLKKEEIESEEAKKYIDVLDRQSIRLKKLVEDLMDASKVSTGNVSVELTKCDAGVLLNQALAEFEEKLNKASIKTVVVMPEQSVKILADGRHLWRVFDNLLNNICKYALENTRAYIDLKVIDKKAVILFRNISRYELNVTAEDLMERFVRGDTSRNTEGSGLGLSIAKSLVELQNGNMELFIDGDLFKAEITFDIIIE